MIEPTIEYSDDDHCLASFKNTFIHVWRRNPTERRAKNMRGVAQQFLRKTSGPVTAIVVVESECQVPEEPARNHCVSYIRDMGDRGKGIALTFEGDGFRAAASRVVMMALVRAAGFGLPYSVVKSVAEGEAFLETCGAPTWKPGELRRAVEIARERIGASSP